MSLISDGTAFGCIGCSSMPVAMEAPYPDELVKVIESRAPAGAMVFARTTCAAAAHLPWVA
jgi:hypothetical protein